MDMLTEVKAKIRTADDIKTHFHGDSPTPIMPISDTKGEHDLTRLVMIPLKWAADLIDKDPSPYKILVYIVRKTNDWADEDEEYQDYLVAWAVAACTADNKTNGKTRSQMHSLLLEVNRSTEELEDWADARLAQTIGGREAAAPSPVLEMGGNRIHPIFQVNMPPLPQPRLDEIELAYMRGADTQKRLTETVVPSDTKYTDAQLLHLLNFCGLGLAARDQLPTIWMIGACESKHDDPSRCIVRSKNRYPTSYQVPGNYTIQLQQAL